MKSKKGLAIPYLLLGIVFVVVMGIVATQAYPLFSELNTEIQGDTEFSETGQNVSAQSFAAFPSTMDYAVATFIAFMFIVNLVFSYMSDNKPFLLFLFYIVLIILIVLAGLLSNAWEDYTDDANVLFESQFPITNWTLDNFMLVLAVFGFTSLIVVFMRERLT